jgi:hypothetical protein
MPPIGTKHLIFALGICTVGAIFIYGLIYVSEAKLQLIVTVAAVGGGCYAVGLNQDSRYSQREIQRLEEENQAMREKVRALKEMYLEDRTPARSVETMVMTPPPPADTITIRGGPLRELLGRLIPTGNISNARIGAPAPESFVPSERAEVRNPVG